MNVNGGNIAARRRRHIRYAYNIGTVTVAGSVFRRTGVFVVVTRHATSRYVNFPALGRSHTSRYQIASRHPLHLFLDSATALRSLRMFNPMLFGTQVKFIVSSLGVGTHFSLRTRFLGTRFSRIQAASGSQFHRSRHCRFLDNVRGTHLFPF